MPEKRTVEAVSRRLAGFYRDQRRMPAYSEMLPLLGVRSKSVVHFWMRKLLEEGILEKDRRGLLRPARRDFALPLVGAIQAGFPMALQKLCHCSSVKTAMAHHRSSPRQR